MKRFCQMLYCVHGSKLLYNFIFQSVYFCLSCVGQNSILRSCLLFIILLLMINPRNNVWLIACHKISIYFTERLELFCYSECVWLLNVFCFACTNSIVPWLWLRWLSPTIAAHWIHIYLLLIVLELESQFGGGWLLCSSLDYLCFSVEVYNSSFHSAWK